MPVIGRFGKPAFIIHDFSEYAKNCGGMGIRVTDEHQLDEAIRRALEYNGPSLVEVMTDAELI